MKCKKFFATLMAMLLIVANMAVLSFADESGFTAQFGFADASWAWQSWDSGSQTTATVNGSGTYKVTIDGSKITADTEAAEGAMVLVVDVLGLAKSADLKGQTITLKDAKLTADGKAVALDVAKVITGDLEEKGNYRMELYNEYGSSKADPAVNPADLKWATTLEYEFTLEITDKEFPVAFEFASAEWVSCVWQDATTAQSTANGSGTYSVTVTPATFANEEGVAPEKVTGSLVFCVDFLEMYSTMAKSGKTMKVTDAKVTADGKEIPVDVAKLVVGDIEEKGNLRVEFYNEYGASKADPAIDVTALDWSESLTVSVTLEEVDIVYDYPIALQYASKDWSFGIWQSADNAAATLTGNGTFTVSVKAADYGTNSDGVIVFCVDILGLAYDIADLEAVKVSNVKIVADGKEVACDSDKVVYGWIESDKSSYRIEIFNEYGSSKENPSIDADAFTFADTMDVTFTIDGLQIVEGINGSENTVFEPIYELDKNGKYNAYIGFQTDVYSFRDPWNSATYGKDSEFFNQITGWKKDAANESIVVPGSLSDTEIAGNGTYKVSASGIEWQREDASFNMLYIGTDIPYGYEDITVSDVKLYLGGNLVKTFEAGFISEEDGTKDGYMKILVINTYNSDLEEFGYAMANDITLEFTVSGFDYDKAADEPATEAPTEVPATEAPTTAPAATEAPATEAPATEAATVADTTIAATENADGGVNVGLIVGIVAAVVVVGGGAGAAAVSKKKKAN